MFVVGVNFRGNHWLKVARHLFPWQEVIRVWSICSHSCPGGQCDLNTPPHHPHTHTHTHHLCGCLVSSPTCTTEQTYKDQVQLIIFYPLPLSLSLSPSPSFSPLLSPSLSPVPLPLPSSSPLSSPPPSPLSPSLQWVCIPLLCVGPTSAPTNHLQHQLAGLGRCVYIQWDHCTHHRVA